MEDRIRNLLEYLDWNQSVELQEMAIKELVNYKDLLIDSIITSTGKHQWLNAVSFVCGLDESYQLKFVPQLLLLLQDMNWPGALEATELMVALEHSELKPHIVNALIQANADNDTIWIAWLKSFIEEIMLEDLLIEYKEIIHKAEW